MTNCTQSFITSYREHASTHWVYSCIAQPYTGVLRFCNKHFYCCSIHIANNSTSTTCRFYYGPYSAHITPVNQWHVTVLVISRANTVSQCHYWHRNRYVALLHNTDTQACATTVVHISAWNYQSNLITASYSQIMICWGFFFFLLCLMQTTGKTCQHHIA